jgi:DNA-directed RNA polymerase specialized sigma24 family protein
VSGLLTRVMMGPPDRPETSDGEILAASVVAPAMFTVLVDAYSDAIYRYLVRRVGLSEAEDLAAESFLRAFRARGTYRPIYPTALPWLYGIATNLVRDHTRAEQRRLEVLSMVVGSCGCRKCVRVRDRRGRRSVRACAAGE